jgi:hypothetical protein
LNVHHGTLKKLLIAAFGTAWLFLRFADQTPFSQTRNAVAVTGTFTSASTVPLRTAVMRLFTGLGFLALALWGGALR